MLETLAYSLDRGVRALSEIFGSPVGSYCRLETVHNDVLVADDGSLLTVLRLEGSLVQVGVEEYRQIVDGLTEKLQSSLSREGHLLQVVFEYDPEASGECIAQMLSPSRQTAHSLGLHIGGLLDDNGQALRKYCAVENCWMVLWTRPAILTAAARKVAQGALKAELTKLFMPQGCQQVAGAMTALTDAHTGFVTGVLDAFRHVNLLAFPLSPREALRDMRLCIDPDFTAADWQARIPGDALSLGLPDPGTPSSQHLHRVVYPDFKAQLFPREGQMLSRTVVCIGERLWGAVIMNLLPQTPRPFQELFRGLAKREGARFPYRVSWLLEPNGLKHLGLRPFLATVLAFASSDNKRFNAAVDGLRALDLEGTCCVGFRICCASWVRIGEQELPVAHARLRRRMAEFAKALQGWGTCDVTEALGDPLLGVTATVPALMPSSPSPHSVAPLEDAIGMLPLRSASPWKAGSLLLRTQDGKVFPYAPNSSQQAAWIDIGVAPMGGGKSVFLNAMNFAFIAQAGLARLPWVSIIDVGPSSSGLITLLRECLPEGQKHLAAYHRLRMTDEYAINPFDTPLGCRQPLPAHRAFLTNFLSLLCTPLDAAAPTQDVPGIVQRAVSLAYDELSDENKPRLYQESALPELHALICRENITLPDNPTWWEVVDALFKRGFVHEAIQAQRHAVPLLSDITAQIQQNQGILNTYDKETCQHVWRAILDALEAYVILREPTRFDLGDAQVISLDLDEVAPRGGATADRQAAVMYMLARQVLGGRFFLMADDVKLMPKLYRRYHRERIEAIREDPKRICYDEAHRVTQNTSVSGQLLEDMKTMARESRKWNISIGLYTQSIDDLPDILIELATTVVILGAGTEKSIDALCSRFSLGGACRHALAHLGKPGAAGSNFVAKFNTGAGRLQLALSLTLGAQSLWAFSTTTEDVTIRNALYQRMPPAEALRILASRYPSGSAKAEVERRRNAVKSVDDGAINAIHEIIDELADGSERVE